MQAAAVESIVAGRHGDAFAVLGPHEGTVSAWLPQAEAAWLIVPSSNGSAVIEMTRAHESGLYTATTARLDYRIRVRLYSGELLEIEDPYRFPPLLTPFERIVGTPSVGSYQIRISYLFALIVYLLIHLAINGAVRLIAHRKVTV